MLPFFKLLKVLSEDDWMQVTNLCLEWYFPVPTKETNKLLLFQQMLSHAVWSFYLYSFIKGFGFGLIIKPQEAVLYCIYLSLLALMHTSIQ